MQGSPRVVKAVDAAPASSRWEDFAYAYDPLGKRIEKYVDGDWWGWS
ncbi:MAG: hypothetical protein ACYTAS_04270 [Planctomycetota bacterium]